MRKIDHFFKILDKKVDEQCSWLFVYFRKYFIFFSSTFLLLLLALALFKGYYNQPYFTASLIRNDLKNIHEALANIDKKCNILQIYGNRVVLDFFTVKKFKGSMVGGLNLAFARRWKGPYLKNNPVIQQRHYEIIKANDGYFIVPGKGVRLPNGKIVGQNFLLSIGSNVSSMLQPGGNLFFKGISLAKKVQFKIGDWDPAFKLDDDTLHEINSVLREFNEAMPFTKNYNDSGVQNAIDVLKV